jgi:hypothetical protein
MAGISLQPYSCQPCIVCCLGRRLIGVEPLTRDYELQILQCPECESVVRLVQRQVGRTKHSSRKVLGRRSATPYWNEVRIPASPC